ncbi:MAG: cell division protein FtsQ/DivIB [Methyloceanibacter sp.]
MPVLRDANGLISRRPKGVWLGRLARERARGKWLALSLLFLTSAVTYGAIIGGQTAQLYDALTGGIAKLAVAGGFGAERITIEGRRYATNAEITAALAAGPQTLMLGFDTDAAKARLEAVPWIKQAKVMRLLPSTLQVVIEERVPYAIWQSKGQTYAVDAEGVVIAPALREAYAHLPLVVGDGAGKHAKALYAELEDFDALTEKMVAALRVGDRRWTLKLTSGLEIMLPDDNVGEALNSLVKLDQDRGLLDKNITAVDLRLLDRVTVRLREPPPTDDPGTPDAATSALPSNGKT